MPNIPNFSVTFNDVDLSTITGVSIYNYNSISLPNRDMKINKLARADKSVLTTAEYSTKEITVFGRVCGDDKEDSENIFNELKSNIQLTNKQLVIPQGDANVGWTATLNGIQTSWFGRWLSFVLIFTCTDPIGKDTATTTLLNVEGISTLTASEDITVEGSYKAEPDIQVTVNTVTGGTNKSITILNSIVGQGITVTRTWANGDILEIDVANKRVIVNGAEVEYTGLFPTFFPGAQSLGYIDTFSTRDVDILATYNKSYS